jgi:RNA polymerase sigma-70 factor (ECF subfamily)
MTRPSQVDLPGHLGPASQSAGAVRVAGARAVFDGLWERYHGAIYGYCCHLTDEHRGADLTQDVFLDAYRALLEGRFDGRNERVWLFENASRRAIDQRRLGWGRLVPGSLERLFRGFLFGSVKRTRERAADLLSGSPRRASAAALTAPARRAEPERVCDMEAERAAAVAAVRRLPPADRAVLWLRERQGLDYDQISRAMGVTRSSTRSTLWRARARLRGEWLRGEWLRGEWLKQEAPK